MEIAKGVQTPIVTGSKNNTAGHSDTTDNSIPYQQAKGLRLD